MRLYHTVIIVIIAIIATIVNASAVVYEYDARNRLIQAEFSNGVVMAYVYDNAGNRLQVRTSTDIGIDTDGDGLPDVLENSVCPRPDDPDSDGDGIEDGVEDANQNGVVDTGETDPCNPDTDGDGLSDGQEDENRNGIVDAGERNPRVKDNTFDTTSATIANLFVTIKEGEKMDYAGTGTFSGCQRYIEARGHEVIDGIDCLKVAVKGHGNNPDPDRDPEWYFIWLAQDIDGVIWMLQIYDALADTTTTYGLANALVWMPADPVSGQRYGQNGNKYYEVLETNVTVPRLGTGAGPFVGCLEVKRTDGDDEDVLYIRPSTGTVKEDWDIGGGNAGWELENSVTSSLPWLFLLLGN